MTMAHRIAVMDAVRSRQVGTTDEIYEQPSNLFTAEFIGSVNLVEGKIDDDQKDYITIRAPILEHAIYVGHGVTGYEGQEVALALRPEKLVLSKEEPRSEEHTSELQSLMRISYAVFCLKKKKTHIKHKIK